MLNLALVGLLTGSLAAGSPDGDRDKDKKNSAAPQAEAPATAAAPEAPADPPAPLVGLVAAAPAPAESPINDTYALGRTAPGSPIRLWAEFGLATVDEYFDTETPDRTDFANDGALKSTRVTVGAEIGLPISLFGFGIGAGGQLNIAQNAFETGSANIESAFEPQQIEVYGTARTSALGIHAGYIFDLGGEDEEGIGSSDGRDALNVGVDFDYPGRGVRVFAGIDYFKLNEDEALDSAPAEPDDDDILFFTTGLGVRFGIVELGAALHYQARLRVAGPGLNPGLPFEEFGSHIGTVAPYLRLTPGFIPASIYIKGAVLNAYTEYGYAIGGANDLAPSIFDGFTAGLSFGFE